MNLDPGSTAVLAVHLQPEVIAPAGALGAQFAQQASERDIVTVVNSLTRDARAAGGAVVFTRVAFRPDYADLVVNIPLLGMVAQAGILQDGADNAAIASHVDVEADDVVVTHQRVSGFCNTDLDLQLRRRGIDTLLIVGVATNVSVESTARQASDLGYRTILVEDACSAADVQTHEASVRNIGLVGEVVSSSEVREALNAIDLAHR